MGYKAVVCRVQNIRSHPNADRLRMATVSGYQIIVGSDQVDGQLGIFFASDGQLSDDFCIKNSLYRKNPKTGEPMGGYFKHDRRVRAIKLRGQYSDGFWIPIQSLDFCGSHKLKEGDEFDTVNGITICQKYITPATRRHMSLGKKAKTKRRVRQYPYFLKHYDTKQLRSNLGSIPQDALLYISEKIHGTSGRTGLHLLKRDEGPIRGFLRRLFGTKQDTYQYVSGSRNVVLGADKEDGFYKDTDFRQIVHDRIASIGLYKGETLYYEIAGFHAKDSPIMSRYDAVDKEMAVQYGKKIVFSYGCDGDSVNSPLGYLYRVFVYRITMSNPDGVVTEYSWEQIRKRCAELGLETVPLLRRCSFTTPQSLLDVCVSLSSGPSSVDLRHPTEGVVVRVEDTDMMDVFKFKSNAFCDLEGIRKNDPNYIDTEEAS